MPIGDHTDGRKYGNIILPIGVFEPADCGCMRCAQLWATSFDHQKATCMTWRRDRNTYNLNWTQLGFP